MLLAQKLQEVASTKRRAVNETCANVCNLKVAQDKLEEERQVVEVEEEEEEEEDFRAEMQAGWASPNCLIQPELLL